MTSWLLSTCLLSAIASTGPTPVTMYHDGVHEKFCDSGLWADPGKIPCKSMYPLGYSISCLTCAEKNKDLCVGKEEHCPASSDACVSVYERTTVVGNEAVTLFMTLCGKCEQYRDGAVRFHKGLIRTNTTCCRHNNCTPPVPTLPPERPYDKYEKIKSNGLRCKSCYASNTKSCDCNTLVNCTGEESRCIFRATYTTGYTYSVAMRGCTTKEMCPNETVSSAKNKLRYDFSCTDKSDDVHRSFWLLFLNVGLLFPFTSSALS